MTDLRKLAEDAVSSISTWYTAECLADVMHTVAVPTIARRDAAFIAACSPDAIIALLDRAERAERELAEERHLATVRGEMLTACERERDEAIEDRKAARDDAARAAAMLAARTMERDEARSRLIESEHLRHVAEECCTDARAALELRPEITPSMAIHFADRIFGRPKAEGSDYANVEINQALIAHAAKAKVTP